MYVSTRPTSDPQARTAIAACLFALAVLSGCGAGEITIAVERASEVVPRPGALRVLLQLLDEPDPLIFLPVGTDDPALDERRFADVPAGTPFYVDVFGCTARDACGAPDVVARGCSERLELQAGESREVVVILELPPAGTTTCAASAAGG